MVLKLCPATKNYLWGGKKLKEKWNKNSDFDTISETWEVSCHKDGLTKISGGEYDGKFLAEIISPTLLGKNCEKFDFFPILNKFIDAKKPLSIQVHPSDEYALKNENQYGKTEMWYILDAEEDAFLYLGLNQDMSKEQFSDAIKCGKICDYLNKVKVKSGETYFIPSGTIHAIGEGITLFEIQQNSSLTYRIFDYDRIDKDGKKRELHIEKAKNVVNLKKYIVPSPHRDTVLEKCKYFSAFVFENEKELLFKDSFFTLTSLCEDVEIKSENEQIALKKGETIFVSPNEKINVSGKKYIVTTIE